MKNKTWPTTKSFLIAAILYFAVDILGFTLGILHFDVGILEFIKPILHFEAAILKFTFPTQFNVLKLVSVATDTFSVGFDYKSTLNTGSCSCGYSSQNTVLGKYCHNIHNHVARGLELAREARHSYLER